MKYFYDTEFLEGTQTPHQWGLKTDTWLRIFGMIFIIIATTLGYFFIHTWLIITICTINFITGMFLFSLSLPSTPPTIELISIGIVSEDNREYYAISKDFNLKEAWNRYQWKDWHSVHEEKLQQKVYWIRENVLKPIWQDLCFQEFKESTQNVLDINGPNAKTLFIEHCMIGYHFDYSDLKRLIKKYGKTNKQIAEEVKNFIYEGYELIIPENVNLYGYYSAYDHVALCWLFGKMIDLPKGLPMYTRDLQQMLDEKANRWTGNLQETTQVYTDTFNSKLDAVQSCISYPKQTNEHNALADARWNKELFNFINNL